MPAHLSAILRAHSVILADDLGIRDQALLYPLIIIKRSTRCYRYLSDLPGLQCIEDPMAFYGDDLRHMVVSLFEPIDLHADKIDDLMALSLFEVGYCEVFGYLS